MRGNGWMQRMLYFLILMLGVYIVYKGGSLFMRQPAVQTVLDGGEVQRKLENAAARTWTGGYAAVLVWKLVSGSTSGVQLSGGTWRDGNKRIGDRAKGSECGQERRTCGGR